MEPLEIRASANDFPLASLTKNRIRKPPAQQKRQPSRAFLRNQAGKHDLFEEPDQNHSSTLERVKGYLRLVEGDTVELFGFGIEETEVDDLPPAKKASANMDDDCMPPPPPPPPPPPLSTVVNAYDDDFEDFDADDFDEEGNPIHMGFDPPSPELTQSQQDSTPLATFVLPPPPPTQPTEKEFITAEALLQSSTTAADNTSNVRTPAFNAAVPLSKKSSSFSVTSTSSNISDRTAKAVISKLEADEEVEDNCTVITVSLTRINDSFGIRIIGGSHGVGIFIRSIHKGGAAHRQGELKKYDHILNVNGINFCHITHEKAVQVLKSCPSPSTFIVSRTFEKSPLKKSRSGSLMSLHLTTKGVLSPSSSPPPPVAEEEDGIPAPQKLWIDEMPTLVDGAESSVKKPAPTKGSQEGQVATENATNTEDSTEEASVAQHGADSSQSKVKADADSSTATSRDDVESASKNSNKSSSSSSKKKKQQQQQQSTADATKTAQEEMKMAQRKGWLKLQDLSKTRSRLNVFHSGQPQRRFVIVQDCIMKHFKKIPKDNKHKDAAYIVLDNTLAVSSFSDRGFHIQTEKVSLNCIADSKTSAQHWVEVLSRIAERQQNTHA